MSNKKEKESKKSKEGSLRLPFKKSGWSNPNCTMRGSHRSWPHLKQILQMESTANLPPNTPTYASIEASPSVLYPQRKYCDITGFVAPYTDPKTRLRYASAEVYQYIHKVLTEDEREKFLALRNAQTKLK